MKIKKEVQLKNKKTLLLRDPKISDAKQLLEHLYICASETDFLCAYASDVKKRTIESEKKWIRDFIKSNNLLIVAEIDGEIIGLAECCFMNSTKAKHRGSIGISIQKKYWNKGIGGVLFDEIIEFAMNTQCTQLELGVIEENERARHLYERKGFEYTGRFPRALRFDDGSYHDELMMTKILR